MATVGVIGVATHWCAPVMAEMIAAHAKGDVALAAELNARMAESFEFETGDLAPNPIPAKAMLRALGLPAGECRLPLGPTPDGLEATALDVHRRLYPA